jgi:hypothetical protein
LCGLPRAGLRPAGILLEVEVGATASPPGVRMGLCWYGEHSDVEGEIENGDEIVLVDDLATMFDSKLVALIQLKREVSRRRLANVNCTNVVALFARDQGAKEAASQQEINLYCLIPFLSEGLPRLRVYMTDREYEIVERSAKFSGSGFAICSTQRVTGRKDIH